MEIEALVLKLQPEDALATGAITCRKIPTLRHKSWDNPMERCLPVVHFFAKLADTCRSLRNCREVVNCSRQIVTEEPENYATGWKIVDGNVEEDFVGDDTKRVHYVMVILHVMLVLIVMVLLELCGCRILIRMIMVLLFPSLS